MPSARRPHLSRYRPSLDTGELVDWESVCEQADWPVILLGNGASRAIWDKYAYSSLYDAARVSTPNRLSPDAVAVFDELDTTNFEFVLGAVQAAKRVARALGTPLYQICRTYKTIQSGLASAVRTAHIPWELTPDETLAYVKEELRRCDFVFSTNYDLLLYWAINHLDDQEPFKDFFWGPNWSFDANDSVLESGVGVYYLHGALHLRRSTLTGLTSKNVASQGNLLSQFGRADLDGHPLVVTEGTASDKLRSIRSSDYLSFAHASLLAAPDGLVVIGHALSPLDDHLVDVLKRRAESGKSRVAVTVRSSGRQAVASRKQEIASRLPGCDLWFVRATTHPLLKPSLQIDSNATVQSNHDAQW